MEYKIKRAVFTCPFFVDFNVILKENRNLKLIKDFWKNILLYVIIVM